MKYLFFPLFILLLIASCGKKEETKLQAINPEAAAFDMGDGSYEVNASVIVKGFQQTEAGDMFHAELHYSVDLQKPNGDIDTNKFADVMIVKEKEKLSDQQLNIQFDLDSTYNKGKYTLLINVLDKGTAQSVTAKKEFDLGDD